MSRSQRVVGHPDSISRFIFHFLSIPSAAKNTFPRPNLALMASAAAESFERSATVPLPFSGDRYRFTALFSVPLPFFATGIVLSLPKQRYRTATVFAAFYRWEKGVFRGKGGDAAKGGNNKKSP
jgi:hypothetical protein